MTWTRKQKLYQQALAHPDRQPDRADLATALRVSEESLTSWEQKEGFWREVNQLAKKEAERALTSVWRALISRARKGDLPAIKLLFSLLGQPPESDPPPNLPVHFKLVLENGNSASVTLDTPPPELPHTPDPT